MEPEKTPETPSQQTGKYEAILKGEHLSVVGQSLEAIPPELGDQHGNTVKQLDLSYNSIRKVDNIQKFKHLNSLVIDNNELDSAQTFPSIPTLQTFWVNNNKISDLKLFLDSVVKSFPNITYLSMLKNPACPNYFTGKDSDDYQRYRYYVLYRLNKLKFLDSSPVTAEERKQAQKVGPYAVIAKPDESLYKKTDSLPQQDQFPALPSDSEPDIKPGGARIGLRRSEQRRKPFHS